MSAILRKYGEATTVTFPLTKAGSVDFALTGDYTPADGDVNISGDDGATFSTPTVSGKFAAAAGGKGLWSLSLTAAEMQADRIDIMVVDSATKAIEDQCIKIETYGNASAQHAFDLDSASVTAGTVSDKTGYSISGTLTTLDALNSGLNDLSAAEVNAEVDTALADIGLDHLLSASVAGTDVADNSIIAKLVSASVTADWDDFDNTKQALQIIGNETTQAPASELASIPASVIKPRTMLQLLYMALRNRVRATTSGLEITQDDGTVIGTGAITESATEVIVGKFS